MLKIYWVGLFLFFSLTTLAQIGGVSGDKLVALNATPLDPFMLELEPTLTYTRSDGFYNTSGEYQTITDIKRSTQMVFRSALGLTENMEIGAQFDTDFTFYNLSAKYHLLGSELFNVGVVAGLNGTLGNDLVGPTDLYEQYLLGLIIDYSFTENISLNVNFTLQDQKEYNESDFFFAADLGYYFVPRQMLLAAVTYQKTSNHTLTPSSKWTFYPCYILERNQYAITISGQFDLAGKNIEATNGVSVTITQIMVK